MLQGVVGVEMEILILVGMGCFSISSCLRDEECDGSITLFFDCQFDVLVNRVKMGVEFSEMLTSEANVAIADIPVPPFRGVVQYLTLSLRRVPSPNLPR